MANSVRPVKTIEISSGPTGKTVRLSRSEERSMRSRLLLSRIQKSGWFEFIWYPLFIISSIAIFLAITIMERSVPLILALSTLEIILSMFANNLVARGYRFALIISVVALLIYTYVSFVEKMWGEVIIQLVAFIPLELAAFFQWKKGVVENDKLEKINNTTLKQIVFGLVAFAVGSTAVFLFLHFVLHQKFAIFNSISIIAFLLGDVLRNRRYRIFWYYFMIGNIASICMWFMVTANLTLYTIPLILSYFATLTNNFNGLFIWNKLEKKSKLTRVVLLSKRNIKINKILDLKHAHTRYTYKASLQKNI